MTTSRAFSQTWAKAFVNDVSLFGPAALTTFDAPGSLNAAQAAYLMRADVKRALHVEDAPAKAWPGPSEEWEYTSTYSACSDVDARDAPSMIDFYKRLAPALSGRILVFNGDTDPCVSYEGTRTAVARVGFSEENAYRPWFFNATAADPKFLTAEKPLLYGPSLATDASGPQLGGHVVDYEHGLSFATVHGSGHMVPQFRPRAALTFIEHVVKNASLAPPLPADAEIAAMTDAAFATFLDAWVDSAQGAAYVAV